MSTPTSTAPAYTTDDVKNMMVGAAQMDVRSWWSRPTTAPWPQDEQ